MSYTVARRTHEIGIRIAVGARRSDIRAMVLRETVWLLVAGVILGVFAATLATRNLQSVLFGLTPTDPLTIAAVVAVVISVAAVAGWLPTRRASNVNPLTALRYE